MSQQQPPPDAIIWALSTAGFAARCLHVVADLGVADRIGDQPVTISELASSCGADPGALDRVLRLLAAHGIFAGQHGSYSHTPSSRLLRSDDPMTMRPFAQMMGLPLCWGSLTEFKHSVQTGKPAVEILEPKGTWAYLQDRPGAARLGRRAVRRDPECDSARGARQRHSLVVEDLMPEEHADPGASALDIIMLAMTGGRERTVDQLGNLFDAAGFGLVRVTGTRSSIRIVEARPA